MSTVMTFESQGWTAKVPAGSYFLGDPCYAVPSHLWNELLDSCEVFEKPVGTVSGVQVLAFGTRWGDGTFEDAQGVSYPVDAGLIGLTPISLAQQRPDFDELTNMGRIVEFTQTTRCERDAKGRLSFGPYCINTDE